MVHAEESLSSLEGRKKLLDDEVAWELEQIRLQTNPDKIPLEQIEIAAKKTDVSVEDVVLAWVPA